LIAKFVPYGLDVLQPELSQSTSGPATGILGRVAFRARHGRHSTFRSFLSLLWRLRDDQPPSETEEGSGTFSHHRGRAKGTDYYAVESAPVERVSTSHLSSLMHDTHPLFEAAGTHCSLEELRPALVGVEEHESGCRPLVRQNETRKPAAGTKVEDQGRAVARLSFGQGDEPFRMAKVPLD
jgi:hypothetical protein